MIYTIFLCFKSPAEFNISDVLWVALKLLHSGRGPGFGLGFGLARGSALNSVGLGRRVRPDLTRV